MPRLRGSARLLGVLSERGDAKMPDPVSDPGSVPGSRPDRSRPRLWSRLLSRQALAPAVGLLIGGLLLGGWLLAGRGSSAGDKADGRAGKSGSGAALIEPTVLGTPWADPRTGAKESQILDVGFSDATHGFALTGICEGTGRPCRYGLRATADGGETWRFHQVPVPPHAAGAGFEAMLSVLGPRAVAVKEQGAGWFSSDAGRSWRQVGAGEAGDPASSEPGGSARYSSIPDGALLRSRCLPGDCTPPQVVAIDPRTGADGPLRRQPELSRHWTVASRKGGREWWVAGAAQTRQPAIAATRDQGRTWQTATFESEPRPVVGMTVLERDGPSAYAFVSLLPDGDRPQAGLGTVYATDDGGRSWSAVDPPDPADPAARPAAVTDGLLLRDGRLLVGTTTGGTMLSGDGGRTFEAVPELPALVSFSAGEGRLVARGTGGFYTSADGLAWSAVGFAD